VNFFVNVVIFAENPVAAPHNNLLLTVHVFRAAISGIISSVFPLDLVFFHLIKVF